MHMPCSSLTPVESNTPGPFRRIDAAFRFYYSVGSHVETFEAQSHGLYTRCLRFAAWVAP